MMTERLPLSPGPRRTPSLEYSRLRVLTGIAILDTRRGQLLRTASIGALPSLAIDYAPVALVADDQSERAFVLTPPLVIAGPPRPDGVGILDARTGVVRLAPSRVSGRAILTAWLPLSLRWWLPWRLPRPAAEPGGTVSVLATAFPEELASCPAFARGARGRRRSSAP